MSGKGFTGAGGTMTVSAAQPPKLLQTSGVFLKPSRCAQTIQPHPTDLCAEEQMNMAVGEQGRLPN